MRYPGCLDRVVCAGDVAVLPDELLQLAGKLEERNLDEPSIMAVLKKHSSLPWGLADSVKGLCTSKQSQ